MTAERVLRAELELFHSRPVAPTRRLALGRQQLPADTGNVSGTGFGGLLAGAVCARFVPALPDGFAQEILALADEIEQGIGIAQPRLRHRLQRDRIGLSRSRQRLYTHRGEITVDFDGSKATPSQLVLGTLYAAATLTGVARIQMVRAARRGLAWSGDIGPELFTFLCGGRASAAHADALADPMGWALTQLGFRRDSDPPAQAAVQRRFRDAVRAVHPDLGADGTAAADRIADLSEARRILLVH